MKNWTRFGLAGLALAGAVGCFLLAGKGSAGDDPKVLAKQVDAIASALQKGDKATAGSLAQKLAKSQDEVYDVMLLQKPRDKKGIGVGKTPNEIVPDGIEQLIRVLARDQQSKDKLAKHKDALVHMGYRTAAIGLFAKLMPPKKDQGEKTKAKWLEFADQMEKASVEFAKAAEGGSPAEVRGTAEKLNNSCNACHSVFR